MIVLSWSDAHVLCLNNNLNPLFISALKIVNHKPSNKVKNDHQTKSLHLNPTSPQVEIGSPRSIPLRHRHELEEHRHQLILCEAPLHSGTTGGTESHHGLTALLIARVYEEKVTICWVFWRTELDTWGSPALEKLIRNEQCCWQLTPLSLNLVLAFLFYLPLTIMVLWSVLHVGSPPNKSWIFARAQEIPGLIQLAPTALFIAKQLAKHVFATINTPWGFPWRGRRKGTHIQMVFLCVSLVPAKRITLPKYPQGRFEELSLLPA